MTIPPTAIVWAETMDPKNIVEWIMDVAPTSRNPLLEPGEIIESWIVALSAEAVSAGLSIMSEGSREAHLINGSTAILLWLQIAEGYLLDPMFSGPGTALSMELTITTNSVPSRTRQRTYVVRIAQL